MNREPTETPAEEAALQDAVRIWLDRIPLTEPPRLRSRPPRFLAAAAALLLFLGSVWLLPRLFPLGAEPEEICELSVSPGRSMGIYAPPSMAEVIARSPIVLELRVTAADPGHLDAERIAVLRGAEEKLPQKYRLLVPMAVSELGAEELRASAGEKALLLLRRREGKLVLATGNAWSVITARSTCYLTTANLHGVGYGERRAQVAGTLRLADRLAELPWEKWAPPLADALRSGGAIARELALDRYAAGRRGQLAPDGTIRNDVGPARPALEPVDLVLLGLMAPRKDAETTLASGAATVLGLLPAKTLTGWLAEPARAEAAFLLFSDLLARKYPPCAPEIRKAVEALASGGDPTTRYLAAALLGREKEVLDTTLPVAAGKRLLEWKHVPAWPPTKLAAWRKKR